MGEQRTVRVRIAVAVDAVGRYKAAGWGGGVDSAKASTAMEAMRFGQPTALVWIEADVPLPVPPAVIEGTVTPAGEGVTNDANPRN